MITRFKESFKEMPNFMPAGNARQTTEVFVENGKIKLQVKRKEISAEEIVSWVNQ